MQWSKWYWTIDAQHSSFPALRALLLTYNSPNTEYTHHSLCAFNFNPPHPRFQSKSRPSNPSHTTIFYILTHKTLHWTFCRTSHPLSPSFEHSSFYFPLASFTTLYTASSRPATRFTCTRCWLRTFCKQWLSEELKILIDRAVTALYPRVELIHSRKVHMARWPCGQTANESSRRSDQLSQFRFVYVTTWLYKQFTRSYAHFIDVTAKREDIIVFESLVQFSNFSEFDEKNSQISLKFDANKANI